MGRLDDKIAIVTGGSRGIGAAIAAAFAREGARVVIASRSQEALDQTAAEINASTLGTVVAKSCHVGKTDQVKALVDWTCENVGTPSIVVSNAGTNPYFGPMLGISDAAWDKTFEVNLKGCFEPMRQVAQRLVAEKRGGSLISVSSILGMRAAPLQGVYGMTKASIVSMTKTLAIELGTLGIRVNTIAPGL
ncbi:MAG: SDR family NAD(P)-dependent oxidoreductase, partial [Myxococcales bacterium]|nr:SDR family NAD(P)-dependent oxidoreductase [Myxococcales bacterium]